MTVTTSQPPVRADSPASMLAMVPSLLGFRPADSLVIVGLEGERHAVKVTLRYDLTLDAATAYGQAQHAAQILTDAGLEGFVAVIYGDTTKGELQRDAILAAATDQGLNPFDILRVEGTRYWSYACQDETCCPAAGTPFDLPDEPVIPGAAVLADREQLAGTIAPRPEPAVDAAVAALDQRNAREVIAEGLARVPGILAEFRAGPAQISAEDVALLAVALASLRVRDDMWARMDPDHRDAHERLLTELTRRVPERFAAGPASLLAVAAWQQGNGALANVALDRALAADPDYSMANLLRQIIDAGTPPALADPPVTPDEVSASYSEN
jgi:hypothetical protein